MAKIITLGELLIDLTQKGKDEHGYGEFIAYPGGAPANVAVAASRLGAESAFIGKVGDDAFGHSLADTLAAEGVDTRGLYFSKEEATTMAIVSVDESGEREFSFYRKPGADTQLTADEAISAIELLSSDESTCKDILHMGSLSLTTSPSMEATLAAIEHAGSRGMLISYDPNYRDALWDDENRAMAAMKSLIPYTDILKVSGEEMQMLTGNSDLEEGSLALQSMSGREALIMVTLGGEGVFVRLDSATEIIEGCKVEVADTNGAGDTFLGAMLAQISTGLWPCANTGFAADPISLSDIEWPELIDMIRCANRAASHTCTGHGAIPAMPYLSDLH